MVQVVARRMHSFEADRRPFSSPDHLKMLCLALHHCIGSESSCFPHTLLGTRGQSSREQQLKFWCYSDEACPSDLLALEGFGQSARQSCCSQLHNKCALAVHQLPYLLVRTEFLGEPVSRPS